MPENPLWTVVLVRPGEEQLALLADLSARRNVRIAAIIDSEGDSVGAQLAPILGIPVLATLDDLQEGEASYLVHPPRDSFTAPVIDAAPDFGLETVAAESFPAWLSGLELIAHEPAATWSPPPPPTVENLEQETAAIHRTLSRIEEALDGESLLRWLLGLATRATGASSGSVLLFDPASEELYLGFAYGLSQHTLHRTRVRLGEGIAGRVAQSREATWIRQDQERNERRDRSSLQSAISCPLVWEGVLLGVLNVSCDVGEAPLADEALDILDSLSHRFAMILDRFERLQGIVNGAAFRELDENFALAQDEGAELAEVLHIWLEDIGRVSHADAIRLTLPTRDGEMVAIDTEAIDYPSADGNGVEEILARGEPRVQTPDEQRDRDVAGSTVFHLPIGRSPVRAVLTSRFSTPAAAHRYHQVAGEILYLLNKHLTGLLERHRLRDEVDRLNSLSEALSELAGVAHSGVPGGDDRILQAARDLTGAQRAFLLTADTDRQLEEAAPAGTLLSAARELLERAVEPGHRATIVTVVHDPQLGHPRSLLAVPLRAGQALPGLVLFDKRRLHLTDGKSFTELDATFAQRLSPLFTAVPPSVELISEPKEIPPDSTVLPETEAVASPLRDESFEQIVKREMDRCDRYHNMVGLAAIRLPADQIAASRVPSLTQDLSLRLRSSDFVGCLADGTILILVPEDIQSLPRLKHRVGELLLELAGVPELKLETATRVYPGGGDTARELLSALIDSLR